MFELQICRRFLVSVFAAAAGFGCSHSPLLEIVANTGKDILSLDSSAPLLTRERINKIPYASVSVKIGRQPRALLILSRYDRANLHWLSADRGALVTNGGRLIKTAGFPANLETTFSYNDDPVRLGTLHTIKNGYKLLRGVDIQPKDQVGVLIDSTFHVARPESIEILDVKFETLRVIEINVARGLDWKFKNTYWADRKSGFVWKSVQHFAPQLPPAEIEILKPTRQPMP